MTREEAAKILNRFFSCIILPRCSGKRMLKEAVDTAFEALKQPEHKKGKWIYPSGIVGFGRCSECKALWDYSLITNRFFRHCPRCGAKMEKEEE